MENKPMSEFKSEMEYLNSWDLEKTSNFLKYHQRVSQIGVEINYHTIKYDFGGIRFQTFERSRKRLPNDLLNEYDRISDILWKREVVNKFIDERKEVA